jgi:hypothetical protein
MVAEAMTYPLPEDAGAPEKASLCSKAVSPSRGGRARRSADDAGGAGDLALAEHI